jgi:L-threonylcarbamoyladenylate synthase
MTPELHRRIEQAAELLRRGGIVAYPTETFYGLGALASSQEALERLARAKLRPEGKPLPVLAADLDTAGEVVAGFEPLAARLAARFWPGPLTLVLPAAPGLARELTAGSDTIGVRVPGSEVARELSRRAGGCIVSTSANLSGGPPATTSAELDPGLVAQLDGVLDGGPTPGGLASTVLAVRDGQLTLLRAGAVPWEALLPFITAPAGTLQGRGG